jgi:hypothetical protein
MKKNKIIKLTENDLVRIIQRVILENNGTSDDDLRNQVTELAGSEVVMYNESGLNRYERGEKGIFKGKRTYENYKIKKAWVSSINGRPTVSFSVTRLDNTDVQDKSGLMKGAFTRNEEPKDVVFRWDCVGHFEKGLGEGNNFRRLGGIKEDYSNTELQSIIQTRPFCDYKTGTQMNKTSTEMKPTVKPIVKNASYRLAPR